MGAGCTGYKICTAYKAYTSRPLLSNTVQPNPLNSTINTKESHKELPSLATRRSTRQGRFLHEVTPSPPLTADRIGGKAKARSCEHNDAGPHIGTVLPEDNLSGGDYDTLAKADPDAAH